ncbi:30S ribosomal protein S21 [Levilactobacillus brevis]|nr:30S ribosomal protein S21 [Levilactobacillus brevis]
MEKQKLGIKSRQKPTLYTQNMDPPRLGTYAGRSVNCSQDTDLPRVFNQLNQLNRINKVQQTKNLQRYHEKPGKAIWRIRMARKRREFKAGIRMLFHLAVQAEKRNL